MQKVTTFLEKNAEWIAIGLAALWLLWIGWAYGINHPYRVEVGGKTATAATVDEVIRDTQARELAMKLESQAVPRMQVRDLAEDFLARMDPGAPEQHAGIFFNSTPVLPRTGMAEALDPLKLQDQALVEQLPPVPAPVIAAVESARDQVEVPELQPVAGELPMRPVRPAPNRPLGLAGPELTDKYWATVFASFDEKRLTRALDEVLPESLQGGEHIYTSVQLVRQEVRPDGTVGEIVEIPSLAMNVPPEMPDKRLEPLEFIDFVRQQNVQSVILQPPFYATLNETWTVPKQFILEDPLLAQQEMLQPWNPETAWQQMQTMTPAEQREYRSKLTPEQKGVLTLYESAKAREERLQNAPPPRDRERDRESDRGRSGRTERGSQRSTRETYQRPERDPLQEYQQRNAQLYGRAVPQPRAGRPDYAEFDPRFGRAGRPEVRPFQQQGMVVPENIARPVAAGGFDEEFPIWAHDETVEPGKTYRYRMRVRIFNPLYKTNVVKDPKLAEFLELPAGEDEGWSEWSEPVSVPARLDFFFASVNPTREEANFNVFRWQDGKTNKKLFRAMPGDVIGGMDKEIDYTTGWMVVDIRSTGNDTRVTLMDERGVEQVRYYRSDSTNPKHKELDDASKPPPLPPFGVGVGVAPGVGEGRFAR